MPGDGTESALMGLATYPETYDTTKAKQKPQVWTKSTVTFDGETVPDISPIAEPSDIVVVGAKPGWSWRDCCKTQYANRHGRDHFLRCHLGLIKLLDYAKEIGILDRVADDGEFWETRSVDVLLKNLGTNDQLVAAIAGGFRDALGDNAGMLVAPITEATNFEALEAEGVAQLGGEFPKPLGDLMASRVRALAAEPFDAPLIAWPQPTPDDNWQPLEAQIDAMRVMNPGLELSILKDVNGMTYLQHSGSGLDVVRIDIPRFTDKLSTALTTYNEQQSRVTLTDGRRARLGIRRIERTATGAILARPRSSSVQRVNNALARAFHAAYGWEMMDKCFAGWCILPGDGEEIWEYEWSYWAAGKDAAFKGRKLRDRDYWAVFATGMIAIRDQYDISREEMQARCLQAVQMELVWCLLLDQEHHDLIVYRPDDVERYTDIEGWTLPEMPDVIFRQEWIHPKGSA
jgi:hypothetical protein